MSTGYFFIFSFSIFPIVQYFFLSHRKKLLYKKATQPTSLYEIYIILGDFIHGLVFLQWLYGESDMTGFMTGIRGVTYYIPWFCYTIQHIFRFHWIFCQTWNYWIHVTGFHDIDIYGERFLNRKMEPLNEMMKQVQLEIFVVSSECIQLGEINSKFSKLFN